MHDISFILYSILKQIFYYGEIVRLLWYVQET